jgi:protein SCO1/2
LWPWAVLAAGLLIWQHAKLAGAPVPTNAVGPTARTFAGHGVVQEIHSHEPIVVIKHEAISNYMSAMTMPFRVRESSVLANLHPGDEITFQLHVTATASWIDRIEKVGTTVLPPPVKKIEPAMTVNSMAANSLLDCKFTNELGQPVRLGDFQGQALGITFFYTRCPLPDYCPRLSKNFQEAEEKLEALASAPTNWHLLSISFDPQFDTPAMLKAYGESYHYDPAHWSFLTGSPDTIAVLAHACGVKYAPDGGAINHNFRTLIIDARGRLQMVFPFTGDFSVSLADQMLKAAAATNPPPPENSP